MAASPQFLRSGGRKKGDSRRKRRELCHGRGSVFQITLSEGLPESHYSSRDDDLQNSTILKKERRSKGRDSISQKKGEKEKNC